MTPRFMAALLVIASGATPENLTPTYIDAVIEICADIYSLDAKKCRCIMREESRYNPNAIGDMGLAVGLWQWHEESIKTALRDMGIVWDWRENGDPRLNVWASTLAACHALNQGWDWWATQKGCDRSWAKEY